MGTEYYLEDHDQKIYYFLGKGDWSGSDFYTTDEDYEPHKKELVDAFSDINSLKLFLNGPYNRFGLVPKFIIDRVADELFLYFKGAQNLEVFSDNYHSPPEDYKEVGEDIYTLRYFGE